MTAVLTLINLSIEFDLINDLGKKRFIVDIYLGKTVISETNRPMSGLKSRNHPARQRPILNRVVHPESEDRVQRR